MYDKDNNKIFEISSSNVNHISYKDLPIQYQNALLSTEDRTFWSNKGINILSTSKAVARLLLSFGRTGDVGGGSTITQQLIKLGLFSTSVKDRTVTRKIKDIWYSLQLTQTASKQQILEAYVNKIYEGQGVYGAETISNLYYNKPLAKLDLAQTATIAGLGQAPDTYDLYSRPKVVLKRRNNVLLGMLNNNKINTAQYKQAVAEPIDKGLIPQNKAFKIQYEKKFPHYTVNRDFIQSVLTEMQEAGQDINKGSYKVYTTLDQKAQDKIFKVLNRSDLFDGYGKKIQSAVTIVDPNNGNVVGVIGGRNEDKQLGINRAIQTNRSSGSSIKPILDYAPAFKYLGYTADTTVSDTPIKYPGTNITIKNYSGTYQGNVSVATALTESLNPPAVETLTKVGFDNAGNFLKSVDIDDSSLILSNALGLNVSTTQLATANSIFSNGGTFYNTNYIKRVVGPDGTFYHKPTGLRVLTQTQAFAIARILTNVIDSANGTAPDARISGLNQAGKSGTVGYEGVFAKGDESDDWMGGFTKADGKDGYSIAVWTGYDYPYKKGGQIHYSQQRISERVYKQIMEYMSSGQSNESW